jgi:hypothetical protein
MRSSLVWMRPSLVWMRPSRVVRASDCRCRSRNSPGSILASSDTAESEGRHMDEYSKIIKTVRRFSVCFTFCRHQHMKSEMTLAAVLICIVVVFLLCHFPRLLLNLLELLRLAEDLRQNISIVP